MTWNRFEASFSEKFDAPVGDDDGDDDNVDNDDDVAVTVDRPETCSDAAKYET